MWNAEKVAAFRVIVHEVSFFSRKRVFVQFEIKAFFKNRLFDIPVRVWQFESVQHPLDVGRRVPACGALERDQRPGLERLVDERVVERG